MSPSSTPQTRSRIPPDPQVYQRRAQQVLDAARDSAYYHRILEMNCEDHNSMPAIPLHRHYKEAEYPGDYSSGESSADSSWESLRTLPSSLRELENWEPGPSRSNLPPQHLPLTAPAYRMEVPEYSWDDEEESDPEHRTHRRTASQYSESVYSRDDQGPNSPSIHRLEPIKYLGTQHKRITWADPLPTRQAKEAKMSQMTDAETASINSSVYSPDEDPAKAIWNLIHAGYGQGGRREYSTQELRGRRHTSAPPAAGPSLSGPINRQPTVEEMVYSVFPRRTSPLHPLEFLSPPSSPSHQSSSPPHKPFQLALEPLPPVRPLQESPPPPPAPPKSPRTLSKAAGKRPETKLSTPPPPVVTRPAIPDAEPLAAFELMREEYLEWEQHRLKNWNSSRVPTAPIASSSRAPPVIRDSQPLCQDPPAAHYGSLDSRFGPYHGYYAPSGGGPLPPMHITNRPRASSSPTGSRSEVSAYLGSHPPLGHHPPQYPFPQYHHQRHRYLPPQPASSSSRPPLQYHHHHHPPPPPPHSQPYPRAMTMAVYPQTRPTSYNPSTNFSNPTNPPLARNFSAPAPGQTSKNSSNWRDKLKSKISSSASGDGNQKRASTSAIQPVPEGNRPIDGSVSSGSLSYREDSGGQGARRRRSKRESMKQSWTRMKTKVEGKMDKMGDKVDNWVAKYVDLESSDEGVKGGTGRGRGRGVAYGGQGWPQSQLVHGHGQGRGGDLGAWEPNHGQERSGWRYERGRGRGGRFDPPLDWGSGPGPAGMGIGRGYGGTYEA